MMEEDDKSGKKEGHAVFRFVSGQGAAAMGAGRGEANASRAMFEQNLVEGCAQHLVLPR